jgi:type II secretory pathway component GspD/PulD (secretin)
MNKKSRISFFSIIICCLLFVGCATQPVEQPAVEVDQLSALEEQVEETALPEAENLEWQISNAGMQQFADTIEQEKLREGSQNVLLQHYLVSARKYANNGQYDEAYQQVEEALKLDPKNREALELRSAYGERLGFPADEIATRLNEAENMIKVRMEQTRVEIEQQMKKGSQCLQNKQYDEAIDLLKRAKEKIRWMPYHSVDLEGKAKQLDFLIQKAEEENEKYKDEIDQKRKLAAAEEQERDELARLKTQQEQVQNLFRQANIAFSKEKYALAKSFCIQIQNIEPDNKDVIKFLDLINQASHAKTMEQNRSSYIEEWKKTFEHVEESMVPMHDIVQFPKYEEWKKISKRGSKNVGSVQEEESSEDKAVRERLESETMDMDFADAPLAEVVDYLRNTTGLNIIIHPDVNKEFPDEDSLKVNLTLTNAKLSSILNLILSLKDLAYSISNGVLIISTQKRMVEKPIVRLYNIRDLTGKLNDFPGVDMTLSTEERDESTISGATLKEEESKESTTTMTEEQLTDLIKNNIGKATWDASDCSIETRPGTLIVRQTESIHKQIDSLLNDLRKATGLLVTIESKFLTVSDDFLEDIGVDWRNLGATTINGREIEGETYYQKDSEASNTPYERHTAIGSSANENGHSRYRTMDDIIVNGESNGFSGYSAGGFYEHNNGKDDDHFNQTIIQGRLENIFDTALGNDTVKSTGGLSMQMAYLDKVELQMILQAVRKKYRSNILTSPRLTVFNTQRANVTIINQQAYVQDYDVEIATNSTIADPVIGVVQSGVVLDVKPIISADKKYITLELQPTVADLIDMKDFKTSVASSEKTQPMLNDQPVTNTTRAAKEITIQAPELKMTKIRTTVTIPDGGTLLIGGLMQATRQDTMSGIPVLSDLPIISFFTSRKGKFTHRESLIILVTANITSMEEKEPNEGREN